LAANLVGVWLAVLLIWPQCGQFFGEFTYGRWMPLHMDWQLYGWCSLPLVGLLMRYFLNEKHGEDAHLGFVVWSIALGIGGILSLHGVVSGKLFLNWSGAGRIAFPVAQIVLWAILANGCLTRWKCLRRYDTKFWFQLILLLLLLVSPLSLFWTAGANVYPPIDPESGGATGHSLLASSLGIIGIFGLLPLFLKLKATPVAKQRGILYGIAFAGSVGAWLMLDHGNASNTQLGQIAGLAILLLWIPLVVLQYRAYVWPQLLLKWLFAFFFWWGFLTVSGFITFLPGVLDVMKFTNGLVAHAHLAMAGMLGAFNMLILGTLGRSQVSDPWSDRSSFWLWQGGTLLYVLSMLVQGVREGLDPTVLFGANAGTSFFYGLRLLAGVILVGANLRWLYLLEQVRRTASVSGHLNGGLVYES
jgi:cytochrome c oxidase cbb3-type subunit 1